MRRGAAGAQPGFPGSPPPHIHFLQTETFEVLRGTFGYVLDGAHATAAAGTTVTVPAGARRRRPPGVPAPAPAVTRGR